MRYYILSDAKLRITFRDYIISDIKTPNLKNIYLLGCNFLLRLGLSRSQFLVYCFLRISALVLLFPIFFGRLSATVGRRSRDPRARVAGIIRDKNGFEASAMDCVRDLFWKIL